MARFATAFLLAALLAEPGGPTDPPAVGDALAASGELHLELMPNGSEARYRAHEQLVGQPLPNEAVGRTQAVSGEIVLSPDGAVVAELSKIVVDLRTLRSDERRRDGWIQQKTLETQTFPTAEFVPRDAPGLPVPLPLGSGATFQLAGDLTVHGVTRPAVWDVTAAFTDQEASGMAVTAVKMTDFNMTPPEVGPVLRLEDDLVLELDFRAAISPPLALAAEPALRR